MIKSYALFLRKYIIQMTQKKKRNQLFIVYNS